MRDEDIEKLIKWLEHLKRQNIEILQYKVELRPNGDNDKGAVFIFEHLYRLEAAMELINQIKLVKQTIMTNN